MTQYDLKPVEQQQANLAHYTLEPTTRARTDAEAAGLWLAKYADSAHTLAAYRKEAERFLLWLGERGQTLADVRIEEVLDYSQFLKDPQPRAKWCLELEPKLLNTGALNPMYRPGKKLGRYLSTGEANPDWRPFVGALGELAQKQAITILFGMSEFLTAISYLSVNPFRAARKRTPQKSAAVERYIERDLLEYLINYLEDLPEETQTEYVTKERVLFSVKFLYLTGLRRDEFTNLKWEDIRFRRNQYWLHVRGKGNRDGAVPVNTAALAALNRYRGALHRGVFDGDDTGPVLRDLTGTHGITGKSLHSLLTSVLRSCPDKRLHQASAHWFRHSAASHMLDSGISLSTVRDHMRHANISTTSCYIHTARDIRYAETENHKI